MADPAHIEAATKNTVRLALARGYVTMERLREALVLREQLEAAGQPASLLNVLAGRYIRPDHHPELSDYYKRQLAALSASPSGSAPPAAPAPVELPRELNAPQDLVSRSVELTRRPPEHDSQGIQAYLRESEMLLQAKPAEEQVVVPDKVFVALAKRAGYPSKEELLGARADQLERRKQGQRLTLFEIVVERGVLDERKARRFRRWAAQVTRRDKAPLEEDDEEPGGAQQRRVLARSAAEITLPQDVDGEISGNNPTTQAAPPASEAEQPRRKKRRVAKALRESAALVARGLTRRVKERAREDPEEASRQAARLMLMAGLICGVVGLGVGLLLGSTGKQKGVASASPTPRPSLAAPKPKPTKPVDAAADPAADAAWEALRRAEVGRAGKAFADFALDHPKDPRAPVAQRTADLLDELDRAGSRESVDALRRLLKRAQALEREDPRGACLLYDALREAAPGTAAATEAGDLRRDLLKRVPGARRAAASAPPDDAAPLPPKNELRRAQPPPKDPQQPAEVEDGGQAGQAGQPPRPQSAMALWNRFCTPYDRGDVAGAATAFEALKGAHPESVQARTASALLAFLREDYETARADLSDLTLRAIEAEGLIYRPKTALVRSAFYTKRYQLARASAQTMSASRRRRWELLCDGPFKARYPLAYEALEGFSKEGRFRVVTDMGVSPQVLDELERKLAKSPERRGSRIQTLRAKHQELHTLGKVLEVARKSFDTLLKGHEPKAVCPTVYVFSREADFRAFSQAIDAGVGPNTLGYYWSPYRILVFYDRDAKTSGLDTSTVEVLLHETFHQWIDLHLLSTPPWFNEGMAEYFAIGGKISSKGLRYGNVPAGASSRLQTIRRSLLSGSTPPLRRLMLSSQSAFMAGASVHYAQAWSFVHYLAESPKRRKLLIRYFKALKGGASRQGAFDEVFAELNLVAMEADWRAHIARLK